jgi:ABC-2 type transport system permease protein
MDERSNLSASMSPPVFDSRKDRGFHDLIVGLQRADMWTLLAMHDVKQRYRRSFLGMFWITAVLGAQVAGIGLVYSGLFNQDISTFLPYLAAGLTAWTLISGILIEGATVFISAAANIRSVVAPISIHVFRCITQHAIIFAHNLLLVAFVAIIFSSNPGFGLVMIIPGFILAVLNLTWVAMLLGMAGARYRDVPLIVASLITLLFILTPVFWRPGMLTRLRYVVDYNPFYYLIEVIRGPLLGTPVPLSTWIGLTLAAVAGWALVIAIYNRMHQRIPFWV